MKSVLSLTVLGLLSLGVFSCRGPEPTPEVRVAPPVEIAVPVVEVKEGPAKAKSAPVRDHRLYSRAGPFRQVQRID